MAYRNPLRNVSNLVAERIDMGVDYSGTGPVYALGTGVIVNTHNAGWPAGNFIAEHLTAGPDKGKYVYVAEDINPAVRVGQKVHSYTKIGDMFAGGSGIETGWAAPPGSGAALGASQFTGNNATAYGANYSDLLASLGAPPGTSSTAPVGTVPASFLSNPEPGSGFTGPQTIPNPLNIPGDVAGSVFNALNPIPHILSALGLSSLSDMLERGALILMGTVLLIIGLYRMGDGSDSGGGGGVVGQAKDAAKDEGKGTLGASGEGAGIAAEAPELAVAAA